MPPRQLDTARENRKDEFYTQLTDIAKEMKYYKEYFKGKTIFCNCDDPRMSNFFRYFALNFEFLGLKKIICTCYKSQDVDLFSDRQSERAVSYVYEGNTDGDVENFSEIQVTPLKGNGDFRSEECIELLKEADIVVTNPPFSLFREYIAQLMKYEKKFIILGNMNAITYKEVFPYIKDNKLWWGPSISSGDREFQVPDDYPLKAAGCRVDEEGRKFIRVKGVRWYEKYKDVVYDIDQLETQIKALMLDDDVTNKKGIYYYVLTGDEKYLNIRAFTEAQKIAVFTKQEGKCPICGNYYDISFMEADHITPWSQGGKTSTENCQMLCRDCNRRKSDK